MVNTKAKINIILFFKFNLFDDDPLQLSVWQQYVVVPATYPSLHEPKQPSYVIKPTLFFNFYKL
jgi:hypothetical protein